MIHIGLDFGGGGSKWSIGAMTDSSIIYCPLRDRRRGILKIDMNTNDVTELVNVNLLHEERGHADNMWESSALALDGCIYFMPWIAHQIMKLDPNNNDAMSSVGDDLGHKFHKYYSGMVIGIDRCVYGIPHEETNTCLALQQW